MEKIRAFDPLLVPIAIMSCALVAAVLYMVALNSRSQLIMEEFEFKFHSEKRRKELELMIAKVKLLQERPRIARRNSTTGRPSNSLLPIHKSSKSQIIRRQSTADLPSKALWSKSQYKPASLMGIPPEIRLMIYDHIIPSKIYAMDWSCHRSKCCLELPEPCENNKLAGRIFKSSLLQVHPKIYREVKELLWNRAVFGLGCTDHAHSSMSWISSRLIRNIEIPVEFDRDFQIRLSNMSKSIPTMNAMARDGLLQYITILVPPFQLQLILDEKLNGTFQFDLLRSFGSARTWSCKMIIRILAYGSYIELLNPLTRLTVNNSSNANISNEKIIQNYKDLFGELNQAWGGTFYLENTLVWENGRHVYRAPAAPLGL
ncbi:hypothetical protein BCON_0023g00480 [Botryotinia convoluta]|uniref:Uncharacterized protein n=1 Tax=Botryotinia convoluta TaxID=54673 RepID=A0A4Z1IKQ9_9HELO|nr:hypothetical protein BCON_0023g00480 [Botryotinia convoluta]